MNDNSHWHQLPPSRPIRAQAKEQAKTLPVIAIVVGGLLTLISMLGWSTLPPAVSLTMVPVMVLVVVIGTRFYVWLDRWEPEPPHFLLAAFVWGAGVSILVAGTFNSIVLLSTGSIGVTAVMAAPLSEETVKGLFFVVVLLSSRTGKAELNSRVDAIVYAGFVGMGFTLVEDMDYVLQMNANGDGIVVGLLRVVTGTFIHAVFTTFTALGIWKGLNSKGSIRWVWPFIGWLAAVIAHAVFNAGSFLGLIGLVVVVLMGIGATAYVVVLAIRSRKEEQELLRRQLPVLAHFGWISRNEAGWMADHDARKASIARAEQQGKPQAKLLQDFIQNVTELCFLRGRLDAMGPGPHPEEMIENHQMLVSLVSLQKPEIDQILGMGRWQQMPPQQGNPHGYPAPGQPWGSGPWRN